MIELAFDCRWGIVTVEGDCDQRTVIVHFLRHLYEAAPGLNQEFSKPRCKAIYHLGQLFSRRCINHAETSRYLGHHRSYDRSAKTAALIPASANNESDAAAITCPPA